MRQTVNEREHLRIKLQSQLRSEFSDVVPVEKQRGNRIGGPRESQSMNPQVNEDVQIWEKWDA